MKIIIISPYAEPELGACSNRVNWMTQTLKESGHSPFVYSYKRKNLLEATGVERFESQYEIIKKTKKEKPDWAIIVGPIGNGTFKIATELRKTTKIMLDTKEDMNKKKTKGLVEFIKNQVYQTRRKKQFEIADHLLFLTESDKKEAETRYRVKKENLTLLPNGTRSETINPKESQREKERKKAGIKPQQTILIYTGTVGDENLIEYVKNNIEIIEKPEVYSIFVIASDGNQEDQNQITKISELLQNAAHLLMQNIPYTEIGKYYSISDIGICPWPDHLKTSLPVKILDYMSGGLYLFCKAPDNSEISKFFFDHEPGQRFSNWQDFNQALKEIIEKKEYSEYRKKNRKKAENIFDFKWQRKKFISLFD
ncbi:glycosyltransferase [Candidatus Micrarchaeota archaeon]|nr:glycosyltransferase [Candidatus Micrarchaeota archaeon]MBU1930205.1 glycosyltransferase [Candidatus Micrarchaeota archaeon]